MSQNLSSFIDGEAFLKAVMEAEERWGAGNGQAKRRLAVKILNAAIDLPWLPEVVEAWLFGLMVDLTIYILNRLLTHGWKERLKTLIDSIPAASEI